MNVVHMEKGPIGKTLLRFAIPVLITQLLQELYNTADCVVVGHYAGENALAAVGLAGLVLSVLINFCVGFASGISAISARLFGGRDYSRLRALMVSVTRSAVWIGIVFSMLGFLLSGKLLIAIKCPETVYTHALRYLRICFLGLTAQLIYNAGAGLLRSLGDTRSTMILFLVTSLLNLLLDVVFVVAMHMGVAGAAAATMLSQWIAALANACQAVWMTFPFCVIYSINQVYLGAIKGLGNTTWPMICTLVCYSLFRVLWCRLLAASSMIVVYSSYDISFVLMLLMLAPVYHRMMRSCDP